MDKWSEDQVKRMTTGGNKKCHDFFKTFLEYSPNMTIQEKYDSEWAQQYRERTSNLASGGGMYAGSGNGGYQASGQGAGGYQGGNLDQKSRNEEFCGAENANRSTEVAPNQGGKYHGVGNSAYTPPSANNGGGGNVNILDDPIAAVSKGWSFLAPTLTSLAGSLRDCEGDTPQELSFKAGDSITDVRPAPDAGWLVGTLGSKTGLFPGNYITVIDAAEAEKPRPPSRPPPLQSIISASTSASSISSLAHRAATTQPSSGMRRDLCAGSLHSESGSDAGFRAALRPAPKLADINTPPPEEDADGAAD
ncbi:ADP-ribosylation factor GTPase-activating protein 1 [Thoreauomyces humboldtii]|nr:ADP-ribosylation factor GTPase-activating protein 1 [Thoreauomyces humboldtii]